MNINISNNFRFIKKLSIKNVSKPIKKPGKNAQISGSLKVIFNSDQGFIIADPKFGIK